MARRDGFRREGEGEAALFGAVEWLREFVEPFLLEHGADATHAPEPEAEAEAEAEPPPRQKGDTAAANAAHGAQDTPQLVTITLPSAEVAAALCAALSSTAGFQSYGGGSSSLFAQGELGIAVELRGLELQLSIDSVDFQLDVVQDVRDWVAIYCLDSREQPPDLPSFGDGLVRLTDALRRRTAGADGILVQAQSGEEEEDVGTEDATLLTGHAAYKRRLQNGEIVQFRGGGNSLAPRIRSGECCKYAPVKTHEDIKQKDIVFCTIKGRYWTHLVKKKTFVGGKDEFLYTISNIKGFENGTIPLGNIYGKCIDHWK